MVLNDRVTTLGYLVEADDIAAFSILAYSTFVPCSIDCAILSLSVSVTILPSTINNECVMDLSHMMSTSVRGMIA